MGGRRLVGLDALRGIAALIVVWQHLIGIYDLPFPAPLGGGAVNIFFMLSGFVMARTYEGKFADGLDTRAFVKLRYRRLWLPMAIGSAIGFVWAILVFGFSFSWLLAFAAILAFLPAIWFPGRFFEINGPAWSLFLEIAANALHVALLARLGRKTLLVICLLTGAAYVLCLAIGSPTLPLGWEGVIPGFCRALSCYLVGILLFRTFGDTALSIPSLLAVAIMTAALVIPTGLSSWLVMSLFTFALCPVILRSALGMETSRVAHWLGALSFPIYGTHYPILRMGKLFELPIIVTCMLALAVAVAVTILFEVRRPRRIAAF